jgi:hypothetical protein
MTEQTTVKSLAGEDVIVFDDADFAELAGFDPTSHSFKLSFQLRPNTLAVLRALWRHGSVVDRSGLAVGHLADRVRSLNTQDDFNINAVLTTPLMQHAVERVTKGRRTMQIALVALPRTWHRKVEGSLAEEPVKDMTPVDPARPIQPQLSLTDDAVPTAVPTADVDAAHYDVADAVATALMARVVEILSNNGTNVLAVKNAQLTGEIANLTRRLGEQTSYVERLRRDLREAQDEVIAAKFDRDGLRARAQAAEHNLRVATGADAQRIIDAEVHRQIDKMMRQAPGSQHGAA